MLSVRNKLMGVYDYFSLDLLLRTLFSPFRQISAGKVRGPIGVQLRAMVDNFISRVIGMVVRSIVIVIGVVVLAVACVLGAVRIALWPFIPALPIMFLAFAGAGWVPWMI